MHNPEEPGSDIGPVTRLIRRCRDGDHAAENELFELLYSDLKKLARYHLNNESPGHSFQPSDLVNEAYLRVREREATLVDRHHFISVASEAMRRVLVDHARKKKRLKRGEGKTIYLEDGLLRVALREDPEDLLAIDLALQDLAKKNPRQSNIVVMRFIGGLSRKEVAEVLGVSEKTISREWTFAVAFLNGVLKAENAAGRS